MALTYLTGGRRTEVSRDRAAPFSRKHRRYWLPVTGGMILIGAINVGLGLCSYERPRDSQAIDLGMAHDAAPDAANTIARSQIPPEVMRAFVAKYPRTVPAGATRIGTTYTIAFSPGGSHAFATFQADGTFVSEE